MYELTEKDKSSGGDKKLEKSADWNGPIKERSCTDVLFILVSYYYLVLLLLLNKHETKSFLHLV